MTEVSDRKAWFSIGRVVRRAWASFRSLALLALAVVAALSVLPDLLVGLLPVDAEAGAYSMVSLPLNLLSLFTQAVLVWAALRHQQGRPAGLMASLRHAGGAFVGLCGVSIISGLGEGLGLLLLVAPGLWLLTVWSVAIPARLMRGAGATSALDDSRELTRGVRWQVFALVLATGIVVLCGAFLPPLLYETVPPGLFWTLTFVLTPLINAANIMILGFGSASLYHELRWGPGSGTENETAEVFA